MSTELITQSAKGKHKNVKKLLEGGSDPNCRDEDGSGWCPLLAASAEGQYQVLQLLIAFGGNVKIVDKEGFSSLHYSARYGHMQCVSYLIEEGCPVDVLNVYKESAADKARQGRHSKVAILLEDAIEKKQYLKDRKLEHDKKQRGLKDFDGISDFVDDELNGYMEIDDISRLSLETGMRGRSTAQVSSQLRSQSQHKVNQHQQRPPPLPSATHPQAVQSFSAASSTHSEDARKIEKVLGNSPVAYSFWVDSFEHEYAVPLDKFIFALEMFNDDRVKIPKIRLKEMDAKSFKTLLNFNDGLKRLFTKEGEDRIDSAVISSPIPKTTSVIIGEAPDPTLERLRKRNPAAYQWWRENFFESSSVSSDLFNLAVQLASDLPIAKITAPTIDVKMFNVLCNGALKGLFIQKD